MDETFKIFIDRLRSGEEEIIHEQIHSSFLDVEEESISFAPSIFIEGTAVLRQKELILQLAIDAVAYLPCTICNASVEYPLHIPDFIHTEAIENIVSRVFDYQDLVREALLLELPMTVECSNGCCPERENMAKYLRKNTDRKTEKAYDHPFADL